MRSTDTFSNGKIFTICDIHSLLFHMHMYAGKRTEQETRIGHTLTQHMPVTSCLITEQEYS